MQRKLKMPVLVLPGVLLLSMQAVNAQTSSPPRATKTLSGEGTLRST
jgi:hypothetical protein